MCRAIILAVPLAGDEHRGRMPRHAVGERERPRCRGLRPRSPSGERSASDLVVELCHLAAEPLALDRLSDHEQHLIGAERLQDEVVGAAAIASSAASSSPYALIMMTSAVPLISLYLSRNASPSRPGHAHVADDEIRGCLDEPLQPDAPSLAARSVCPSACRMSVRCGGAELVVDDEDVHDRAMVGTGSTSSSRGSAERPAFRARAGRARGTPLLLRVPTAPRRCPGSSRRCGARSRGRAHVPLPGSRVVKNGSKMRSLSCSGTPGPESATTIFTTSSGRCSDASQRRTRGDGSCGIGAGRVAGTVIPSSSVARDMHVVRIATLPSPPRRAPR